MSDELFNVARDDRLDPVWGQLAADILNRREMVYWTGDSNGTSGTGPSEVNWIVFDEGNSGESAWKSNVSIGGDNRTRITPTRPGWYLCLASAVSPSPTSWTRLIFARNGGYRAGATSGSIPGTADYLALTFWCPLNGTSDYVEVGWQSGDGAELTDADFSVIWMKE